MMQILMGFWSDPALVFQEDAAMALNSIVDAHRSQCMPGGCDIDCNNWFAKVMFGLCCNTGEGKVRAELNDRLHVVSVDLA